MKVVNKTSKMNELSRYKDELLILLQKSSESFEKQINYISAGAIGLSMVVVDKIIKDITNSDCKSVLVISWVFLTLTLVGNLISHIYTFNTHSKTINDITNQEYNYVKAKKRNECIKMWNIISATMLVIGVALFIIYISLNI